MAGGAIKTAFNQMTINLTPSFRHRLTRSARLPRTMTPPPPLPTYSTDNTLVREIEAAAAQRPSSPQYILSVYI